MQESDNTFNPPAITNPPPQIFGQLSGNPSPILPDFNFTDGFNDAQENDGGHDETIDAKRRRIARACDMCRKKKIKCDGAMPACKNCINYKTECIFTQVERKRNPPKGAKYIEGLENRLGRMESLLKLSGLLNSEDGDRTDLGMLEKRLADRHSQSSSGTPTRVPDQSPHPDSQPRHDSPNHTPQMERILTPHSSIASPGAPKEKSPEVEELSDQMCSLLTNNCGESRYIGSSSGFSIFSPKGIQWVNEKTGDSSFQEMVTSASMHDVKWAYWKPEVFSDIFARRTFQQLPPREEALSLLTDFFENFNCMFPLFHEPTFMHLVNKHYSKNPYEGGGWWASLNVALAIAHRLRVMSGLVPQEEDRKAWGFLKNAMGTLTELTMRNTDLLSVQALLGMALFLLGTPNPQPSFFLLSAAIRLAHSIGLHKRGSSFNLNQVEIEQRKRVFWIAYLVDKDICLRSGRPPAQDDDDMNVDLPIEDPSDNIGNIPLADGKGKANLFRFMCTFAIIESKVYKQLYSTKASKQSDGALLNTIGELDRELEEWKDGIPLDFRPEHEIKASHTPLIIHVVVLHFAYYNCLTTIHRMSVHHGYWTSRLSNYAIQGLNARPLNPRVFSSAALCVQAARASIHLTRYIPQGDFSCVWLILYFPVSALVTIFANILQNPQDPRARSDVKLMNQVVNFLSLQAVTEEQGAIKRMLSVCTEFERIARVVLDKADRESSRRKRRSSKMNTMEIDNPPVPPQPLPPKRACPPSPQSKNASSPQNIFTPSLTGETLSSPSFNPSLHGFSPSLSDMNINLDFTANSTTNQQAPANLANPHPNPNQPNNNINTNNNTINDFSSLLPDDITFLHPQDLSQYQTEGTGSSAAAPLNMGSFQQPFVPQDLWQMPMTLEWDWADMTGVTNLGGGVEGGEGQMEMGEGGLGGREW